MAVGFTSVRRKQTNHWIIDSWVYWCFFRSGGAPKRKSVFGLEDLIYSAWVTRKAITIGLGVWDNVRKKYPYCYCDRFQYTYRTVLAKALFLLILILKRVAITSACTCSANAWSVGLPLPARVSDTVPYSNHSFHIATLIGVWYQVTAPSPPGRQLKCTRV